jgi:hypothetical protein
MTSRSSCDITSVTNQVVLQLTVSQIPNLVKPIAAIRNYDGIRLV